MNITKENRQMWLDLYRAAEVYRDLKPWEWMYDSDLFGVQDPVTGKIGYCCVLGNLGEHMALNVYMGAEGLTSYYELLEFGEDDPMMAGLRQNCISVSFEDRDMLSDKDRKFIKELGLKYRGAGQWVMVREYAPSWLPWYVNEEQAAFLIHALQQAVAVSIRAEENSELLQFDEEKVLVRVPRQTQEGLVWEDQIMDMPDTDVSIAIRPDAALMKKAKKLKKQQGAMFLCLTYAPGPTREDAQSRPFFPMIGLVMDKQNGMIVAHEIFSPDDIDSKLQHWLVWVLENIYECRPQQMILPNGVAADMLDDIADELEIDLIVNPEEPVFEEALEMMFRFMG